MFDSLSPADQIETLYNEIFLRQSDAGGLAYWVNSYNNGQSIDDIAAFFVDSIEMNDYLVKTAGWDFSF